MSEADLKELCDSSSCLIFGGLGFTGNNPWYNARGGVYQSVVSESEDVARTARFRDTYNKLLRCAGDKCVLVLTHTPIQDWSDDQYSTNWIYINGHTHQNRISKRIMELAFFLTHKSVIIQNHGSLSVCP